ncbi:alpha/beta fold hydrolase [Parasphingorhabdus sp.]|uniref:alpha/beta fold hydrolase n=1 Tax=Parasphingorhabdus sp. TaxID=2709688 RepID=UPI003A90C1D4
METGCLDELDFGEMSRLDINGTDIEMFIAGTGAPLLYLHGIDGVEEAADFLKPLSQHFTVYAPTHPGFGTSALPERFDRVDDLGYFYLDMMDILSLDQPVIVGSSFGGWVAAEMLTKESNRASKMILISPFGLKTAQRREQYVADIFMMSKQELGTSLQLGTPPLGSDFQTLANLPEDRLRRLMRNDEALSLYAWTPYMNNPKLGDRLHRIHCPSLVIWGAEDSLITPAYRAAFGNALPSAETSVFEKAGHRVHADQPEKLAAQIAAFAN